MALSAPEYRIKFYRKIGNNCIQIFDSNTSIKKEDVISITVNTNVSGEVGSAEIEFDNEPPISLGSYGTFQLEDIVDIYLGFGENLSKVFSGIVQEIEQSSKDEEKTLIIRAKDWAYILLLSKISASYPEGENVATIVKDLIAPVLKVYESDVNGNAADGMIYNIAGTYSAARNSQTGTVDATSSTIQVGQAQNVQSGSGTLFSDGQNITINQGWQTVGSGNYLKYIDDNYIRRLIEMKATGTLYRYTAYFSYDIMQWTIVTSGGGEPLQSDDGDTSYIKIENNSQNLGAMMSYYKIDYYLEGWDYATFYSAVLQIKAKCTDYPNTTSAVRAYISFDGSSWTYVGEFYINSSGYSWYSLDITQYVYDSFKYLDLRIRLEFCGIGGVNPRGETRITCMRLKLEGSYARGTYKTIGEWTFDDLPGGVSDNAVINLRIEIHGRISLTSSPKITSTSLYAYFWDGSNWVKQYVAVFWHNENSWTEKSIGVINIPNTKSVINSIKLRLETGTPAGYYDPNYSAIYLDITRVTLTYTYSNPPTFVVSRGYLFFETNLPEEANIQSALISMNFTAVTTGQTNYKEFDLVVQKGINDYYPHKPLQASDFDYTKYTGELGKLRINRDTTTGENVILLNEDGIAHIKKSGLNKFVLRTSTDIAGEFPVLGYGHGVAITASGYQYDPKLIIFYTLPPSYCDRELGAEIEPMSSTRQLDFVGETVLDALNKVAMVAEADWYVTPEKILKFWKRDISGKTPVATLKSEHFEDYSIIDPEENLCNEVDFYGAPEKTFPWNCDLIESEYQSWWSAGGNCYLEWKDTPKPKSGRKLLKICLPYESAWNFEQVNRGTCWYVVSPLGWTGVLYWVIFPPDGKKIRFNAAGVYHEGDGTAKIYYAFAPPGETPGSWIQMGSGWSTNEFKCKFAAADPDSCNWNNVYSNTYYVLGNVDSVLHVKYELSLGWGQRGCLANPAVWWAVDGEKTETFMATVRIPEGYRFSLDNPESFRKLKFAAAAKIANLAGSPDFDVQLEFESGKTCVFKAHFFGTDPGKEGVKWTTVEVPLGPGTEEQGWDSEPVGAYPGDRVSSVTFIYRVPVRIYDSTDYLLLDWVHFAEGRFHGYYKDSTSQEKYGRRYKEIYDDTVFSDAAAQRRAEKFIKKFKDPISTIDKAKAEFNGQQNLRPGDIIQIDIPEFSSPQKYRIERIKHEYTPDHEYFVELVLSLDPIEWETKLADLQSRISKLERRRFVRKRYPEPTEVD